MICINCHYQKTQVTNSRPHKTQPRVWRRRSCPRCLTVVTTYEYIDTTDQITINSQPFSLAHLAVVLHRYLPESPSRADEAFALAQTIGESLLAEKRPDISREALIRQVWQTLSRYNTKSGLRYGVDYDCIEIRR